MANLVVVVLVVVVVVLVHYEGMSGKATDQTLSAIAGYEE